MWSIGRAVLVAVLLAVSVSGQGRTSPASPGSVGTAGTAGSCEALSSLSMPNMRVTSATLVAAGAFTPPGEAGRGGRGNAFGRLRSFCRVAATLTPSSDSDIKIEVWLPASRLERQVPGGRQRRLGRRRSATRRWPTALRARLRDGSTDTGHVGGSGSFALGHPEKLIDFAYRSEHEMTVEGQGDRSRRSTAARRSSRTGTAARPADGRR